MMANEYATRITSDIDYEALRIEICIDSHEEAVVITQEEGIENARLEFWYPLNNKAKWQLEYHRFLRVLRESLDELALKHVYPVTDSNEASSFVTAVAEESGFNKPVVKLYFRGEYLGLISQEEGLEQAQLEVVACPYNKYWEFSYRGFVDCLKEAYNKIS